MLRILAIHSKVPKGSYQVTFTGTTGTTFDFTGKGTSIKLISENASVSGKSVTCEDENDVVVQVNYNLHTKYKYTFESNTYISNMVVKKVSGTLPLRKEGATVENLFKSSGIIQTEGPLFKLINPTNINGTFYLASKLTSITADLFEGCTAVTDMIGVFQETSLNDIPVGLLNECTNLKYADCMFCKTKITTIPSNLFKYNSHILRFGCIALNGKTSGVYPGCFDQTLITNIPEDIFDTCTSATNFEYTFRQCPNLTTVPQGFQFPPSARIFGGYDSSFGAFRSCTSLTSIPNNMFALLTSKYTDCDFRYVFDNTPLKTSPSSCSSSLSKTTPKTMFPSAWSYKDRINAFNTCFGTTLDSTVESNDNVTVFNKTYTE